MTANAVVARWVNKTEVINDPLGLQHRLSSRKCIVLLGMKSEDGQKLVRI